MTDYGTPASQIKGIGLNQSTEDSLSPISNVIAIAVNMSDSADDFGVPISGIGSIALEKSEGLIDFGTPVNYISGIALTKDESESNFGTPIEQTSGIALERIDDGIDWSIPPILIDGFLYYAPSRPADYGLTYCFGELCYCPAMERARQLSCTYPLVATKTESVDVWVVIFDMDGLVILGASPDASGDMYGFTYKLWLNPPSEPGKKRIISGELVRLISKCTDCCTCEGISIGYTTQQMSVNTTQTLTVVGAVEGCTYDWAIASGGGSLSSNTGTSVVYTAPDSNAECAFNPTIILSCGGTQCGSLQIAVNAVSGSNPASASKTAIACTTYATYFQCSVHILTLNCNGTVYYDDNGEPCDYNANAVCGSQYPGAPCYGGSCSTCYIYAGESKDEYGEYYLCKIGSGSALGTIDIRTAAQKTAGCCPAALL